jgi:hypothetical protein
VAVECCDGAGGGGVNDGAVTLDFDGERAESGMMELIRSFGRDVLGPWVGLLLGVVPCPDECTAFALSGTSQNVFGESLCGRGLRTRVDESNVRSSRRVRCSIQRLECSELGVDAGDECGGFLLLGIEHASVQGRRRDEIEMSNG